MKLIDFIECFDYSIEDILVEVWLDPYDFKESFAKHNWEYELEYTGVMTGIPITLANCYMTHDCYIDNGKLCIYVSDRNRDFQ
jgi:hypothetical protein